jgi:hypothetical protein
MLILSKCSCTRVVYLDKLHPLKDYLFEDDNGLSALQNKGKIASEQDFGLFDHFIDPAQVWL